MKDLLAREPQAKSCRGWRNKGHGNVVATPAARLHLLSHSHLPKGHRQKLRHFLCREWIQNSAKQLSSKVTEPVLEIQGRANPGFLTLVLVLFPLGYSRQKSKFVMIYEAYGFWLMEQYSLPVVDLLVFFWVKNCQRDWILRASKRARKWPNV